MNENCHAHSLRYNRGCFYFLTLKLWKITTFLLACEHVFSLNKLFPYLPSSMKIDLTSRGNATCAFFSPKVFNVRLYNVLFFSLLYFSSFITFKATQKTQLFCLLFGVCLAYHESKKRTENKWWNQGKANIWLIRSCCHIFNT